eukprot:5372902-Prymnesium_polylepis.1
MKRLGLRARFSRPCRIWGVRKGRHGSSMGRTLALRCACKYAGGEVLRTYQVHVPGLGVPYVPNMRPQIPPQHTTDTPGVAQ